MSKQSGSNKTNIVIVGGGAAGIAITRLLSTKLDISKHRLILINPRPYGIHLLAAIRLTVSDVDHLEDTALLPYDKLFINDNGSIKVGSVVSIAENGGGRGGVVTLEDGEQVPYEILVLTPGSTWKDHISFPDDEHLVTEHIREWRHKFEKAQDIVLVGGGAVGIESAGEIKDIWPNKKVTIVQGDNLLLNDTYPAKFRKSMAANLAARGVKVISGDYVDDYPADSIVGVTTRNGKKLNADLVIATTGPRPNTGFVSSLGSGALTERGNIKVKPTLQLSSHPSIYAAGDVIEWPEQKQAAKVGGHAAVVVANIVSSLRGKSPVAEYKGATELIVVTNGKSGGMAYMNILWGLTFGNWFARMVKSKELLIPMGRKSVGLS